ncbi:hypothetical protein QEZ54_10215 [Catellatospora sp. KI3]|uniref:hypothetical protein n=1 Tax=Catellatospora sp. KI3 TaxID=3041620 RepID=UPI00248320BD|nr:hypothetical protein [Catellatospora sp. KI3]MDI1461342.1 hypothetical protein [Catellatospora sp. KI3]
MTALVDGTVGGLRLPDALLAAMRDGRWRAPAHEVLARVFDHEPDWPSFYGLDSIAGQNDPYQQWSAQELSKSLYIPRPGVGVDNTRSVIIGDLGIDTPIVLDYRLDPARPRVLFLGDRDLGWREITVDIETLISRLGL